MDKSMVFGWVKFEDLRDDIPQKTETEDFWENVPEHSDKYIITSRVTGV